MTTVSTTRQTPSIIRAVRAELVKLHNNTAPITVTVLPFVMCGMVAIASMTSPYTTRPLNAWLDTAVSMITFWSLLLPFFVALTTALLASTEQSNNMWKHLFALPISRRSIYVSKQLIAIALFGLSQLVVIGSVILAGLILRSLKPDYGFDVAIPLLDMFGLAVMTWLASWLIISLHLWMSVRFASFGPAIGFGLLAFLLNMLINQRTDWWPRLFPWSLPANFFATGLDRVLVASPIKSEIATTSIVISVIGSLVVLAIASWEVTRRDVEK
jgi:hypothetical protein